MHWVDDSNVALLTDLYELTMAASYHAHGMTGPATFDLFVRRLPEQRNFLVVCGIEDALDYLESLRFDDGAVAYMRSLGMFGEPFLSQLRSFRFSGEVWAMAEGEVVFGQEPLMRVTAPRIEAQIVETFLLNCVTYQTMVASKAARVALACEGRPFVDFSPRRDHGADAALKAARATYIGGASATSNVLAGREYGIPLSGTMAHSYVLAFDDELAAFRTYAADFPRDAVLLIDTYDTLAGARRASLVAKEVRERGGQVRGVRLDSGDLGSLAGDVRAILDAEGCQDVQIFASGDLDEYRIHDLLSSGAPIDAFGVGTRLGTSDDAPSLSTVYKLVEDERGPRMKFSTGKMTLPGRKQVWRRDADRTLFGDTIALEGEPQEGRPLLRRAMVSGRRVVPAEPLADPRARCAAGIAALPAELWSLQQASAYPVELSPALQRLIVAERAEEH